MFFIIVLEMSGLVRPYGFRFSISSVGSSVARASDASVSIIRFTHNIWIAFSGESCQTTHDDDASVTPQFHASVQLTEDGQGVRTLLSAAAPLRFLELKGTWFGFSPIIYLLKYKGRT